MNSPTVERDEPTDVEARLRALLSAQADEVIAGATPVLWPETIPSNGLERPRRRLALVALAAVSAAALFAAVLVTVRPDGDGTVPATTTPVVTDPAPDGPIGPDEVRMVDNAYLELVAEDLPPGFVEVTEPLDSMWFDAAVIVIDPLVCMEWRPVDRGAECSAVGGDVLRWYADPQRGLGVVVRVTHGDRLSLFDPAREPQDGPVVRGHPTTRVPRSTNRVSGDLSETELPTLHWKERNDQLVSITLVGNADALAAVDDAEAAAMLDTAALGAQVVRQPRDRPAMLVARYPAGSALEGQPWFAMDGPTDAPCLISPSRGVSGCLLGPLGGRLATFELASGLGLPAPGYFGLARSDVGAVRLSRKNGGAGSEDVETVAVRGFTDRFFFVGARKGVVPGGLIPLTSDGRTIVVLASDGFREPGVADGVIGDQAWRISTSTAVLGPGQASVCIHVEFPPAAPTEVVCIAAGVRPALEARIIGEFVVGVVRRGSRVTIGGVDAVMVTPECPPQASCTFIAYFVAPRVDGDDRVVVFDGEREIVSTVATQPDPNESLFNPDPPIDDHNNAAALE